jgi:hypothetical protein
MINDEIGVTHAILLPVNSVNQCISIVVNVAKLLKKQRAG